MRRVGSETSTGPANPVSTQKTVSRVPMRIGTTKAGFPFEVISCRRTSPARHCAWCGVRAAPKGAARKTRIAKRQTRTTRINVNIHRSRGGSIVARLLMYSKDFSRTRHHIAPSVGSSLFVFIFFSTTLARQSVEEGVSIVANGVQTYRVLARDASSSANVDVRARWRRSREEDHQLPPPHCVCGPRAGGNLIHDASNSSRSSSSKSLTLLSLYCGLAS